jgi:hypothetical protein
MCLTDIDSFNYCIPFVLKYKNQNSISPNNKSVYYIELHALTYPRSYTQLLSRSLKYIHE